jgi:predicted RNase H-like nuclease
VKRDDVLDAVVLALSASRPLTRVPAVADEEVPRDAEGLPMEIRCPEIGLFDNNSDG